MVAGIVVSYYWPVGGAGLDLLQIWGKLASWNSHQHIRISADDLSAINSMEYLESQQLCHVQVGATCFRWQSVHLTGKS